MNMEEAEDQENRKCNVGCEKEFDFYRSRCSQLEERSRKAEQRCMELELEVEKKKSEFELLEVKFKALDAEKLVLEEEIEVSKRRGDELEEQIARIEDGNKVGGEGKRERERIVDLTDENEEEEKVAQLMIENRVLDCEKKQAESEVEVWKEKCRELEVRVLQLGKESLALRGQEFPLAGKVDFHEGIGAKDISNVSKPEDVLDGAASLDHVQTKEIMVDCVQTVHDSPGKGSTCSSLGKGIEGLQVTGTPIDTPCQHSVYIKGGKRGIQLQAQMQYGNRVRKQLVFGEEGTPNKKMAPSTPGGAKPASVGVIDISDSDDEPDNIHIHTHTTTPEVCGSKMVSASKHYALREHKKTISKNSLNRSCLDQSDEEDVNGCKENLLFISTPKRRRASNVVTSDGDSDGDSDDDDNIPICKLKKKHLDELVHEPTGSNLNACSVTASISGVGNVTDFVTPRRRRLLTMRQCEEKIEPARDSPCNLKTSETKCYQAVPMNEHVEDEEMKEVESDSEGESLGGFIVDRSDVSDGNDSSSESDVSDANLDFEEILSKIQRNRDHKSVWEFEADMLSAFGKDPELCMKAVCALYRQQTSEEKCSKEALYHNRRGFSKLDALRGTTLAEFLTDGDPRGEVKKSVKELQAYDPKALELCKTLATHYSKQLFEIYKSKEDPLFLPS